MDSITTILPFHDDDHDHDHDHGHEHGEVEPGALYAKITAMCVLFVASSICGLAPFKLSQWLKWTESDDARTSTVVSVLLSLGGGVLLSTTFLHLQPEIDETISHLQSEGHMPDLHFSLAPFLMCAGFFIIYFVEELVHAYLHRHEKQLQHQHEANDASGAFIRGINARESVLLKRKKKSTEFRNASISTAELITDDVENQKKVAEEDANSNNNVVVQENGVGVSQHRNSSQIDQRHHSHGGHGHSHMPIFQTEEESVLVSSLRGLLIVLALSIHELFEGLAVGLEPTSANAWYMFAAVSAHKLVIAFCIGVELVVIRTKLWLGILYVIIFAIVSPIGIGCGILLSETGNSEAYAVPSVVLQGLASGTLLYVIFFEVLSKEKSGIFQYFAVLVGFFLMFGLQMLTHHQHSHGGHGHSHEHEHDHEHEHEHEHNH